MSNLPVKTSHERHRSHSNDWICLFQVVFPLGSLLVLVLLRHLLDRLPPSSPQQLPPLRRQPGLDDHLSNAQGETRCQVLIFIFPSGVPSFPSVWHDKPCLLDQPHQVSCLKTNIEPLVLSVISFSFSRISDYYHHPYDVVTGALVGITFASSTLLVMADVFNKRSAFWKSLEPAPLPEQSGGNNRELNIPYIDEPEPNSQVNIFSSLPYKSTFSGHSENECGFLTEDGQFTCPSISTTLKLIPQNIYAAKNMI